MCLKTCCCSVRASAAPRALEASLLADDTFDRLRPIAQRAGAHHAPPPLPVPPPFPDRMVSAQQRKRTSSTRRR
jgi:hypothetical protein